jgi:uncharacterized membrane protein
MANKKEAPIPIRLPSDLLAEIERVSAITDISKQDIMRLAMRIGLADMDAIEHDAAKLIQQAAEDKGTSFSAWAKAQTRSPKIQTPPPAPEEILKLAEDPVPYDLPPWPDQRIIRHGSADQSLEAAEEQAAILTRLTQSKAKSKRP